MYQLTETEWIWRDGEFIRWADARIHVMSHSVQYGSSVFEGVRCYETKRGPAIFRLDAHAVIDCYAQFLFAAQVTPCCLD